MMVHPHHTSHRQEVLESQDRKASHPVTCANCAGTGASSPDITCILDLNVELRRFLKKNLPRCGPRQCGRTPCLPPAGGGWRGEHVDGVSTPALLPPTPCGGRQESRRGD